MEEKGSSAGKRVSLSSDSVSTLNSEDFVLVSRLGEDHPATSTTNNGGDDEKPALKVRERERERQTARETQKRGTSIEY
ncbi:hypothetical protein NHX12_027003 [Muraenolepis orangiensis]|uniref:Uncharacterized protein n=1 Tax=Muraenolepis orangiensis TaxID=630683 RepID=A0A9Q0EI66_9TELE|nr:hypothetical protein NHX12_027003 [Muraenolepis orangiensis]